MRDQPPLGHISPFFIVSNVPRAIKFYEEKLGFETRFLAPEDEPFFAIVGRDGQVLSLLDTEEGDLASDERTAGAVRFACSSSSSARIASS